MGGGSGGRERERIVTNTQLESIHIPNSSLKSMSLCSSRAKNFLTVEAGGAVPSSTCTGVCNNKTVKSADEFTLHSHTT